MISVFNAMFVQWIVEQTGLPLTTILAIASVLIFLVLVLVFVCCVSEFRR